MLEVSQAAQVSAAMIQPREGDTLPDGFSDTFSPITLDFRASCTWKRSLKNKAASLKRRLVTHRCWTRHCLLRVQLIPKKSPSRRSTCCVCNLNSMKALAVGREVAITWESAEDCLDWA